MGQIRNVINDRKISIGLLLNTVVGRRCLPGELSLSRARRYRWHWQVTTYVGKPSTTGQSARPTESFILSGSTNE